MLYYAITTARAVADQKKGWLKMKLIKTAEICPKCGRAFWFIRPVGWSIYPICDDCLKNTAWGF